MCPVLRDVQPGEQPLFCGGGPKLVRSRFRAGTALAVAGFGFWLQLPLSCGGSGGFGNSAQDRSRRSLFQKTLAGGESFRVQKKSAALGLSPRVEGVGAGI